MGCTLKIKPLILAAASVGALASYAADPVAVWDRDFTTLTQGTYTLSENGNTKNDSYLQISGDNGILVTRSESINVFTVIVRCSGLNLSSANAQVLFTANETGPNNTRPNLVGVNLPANNAACRGIWAGAAWDPTSSTAGYAQYVQNQVPANYTTLIYNHQQTNGNYAYALGPTSDVDDTVVCTTLYSIIGLRSSGSTYNGFAIGGLRTDTSATLLPATGLKITSIAVFSGTLTEAEMKGYYFPSEIQTINVSTDTSVSEINAMFDSDNYKVADVTVTDGVTITVDAAFSAKILSVSSAGTITLAAGSQPDASYLSAVDFSGVQGALIRSWLTPGVVGINFNKEKGNVVSGELVTSSGWVETTGASGNSTALFSDGITKVTWSASNVYRYNGDDSESDSFLHGYLDDGGNNGNGAEIYIDNVPYETYDVVIYASTDTSGAQFQAKTVNGTVYTVDPVGVVSEGNAVWGMSRLESPIYGQNAMRIKNLSGRLTIYGGLNTYSSDGARGGIAAIQIMPPTAEDNIAEYTLTLNGTATNWSEGTWKIGDTTVGAPTSGYATINLSASTTLTIDESVSLVQLTVNAEEDAVLTLVNGESGSLAANYKVVVKSGVLQQGSASVLGATPILEVEDGATFDMNGLGINASTKVYLAGAGAGDWPWALTSSSGAGGAILGGLYLADNATIGGANELKIGQTQAGYNCYLQGFTLTKTGSGALTGTNMNTPGTGTIDVQGGAMSVNQWHNLNSASGDTTVILHPDTSLANGTDRVISMGTLKLLGGTLTTTRAFKVNKLLTGSGEAGKLAFANDASTSLTGNLTVTEALTLDGAMTFNKDPNAESDVEVRVDGTLTASGDITVCPGVVLNLGVNRPTVTNIVEEGSAIAVKMQNSSDVITLYVSAQPTIHLYDENGDEVYSKRVTYEDGMLTIMPSVPTLVAGGTVAYDTKANWMDSVMPVNEGDAIIELTSDATITVAGTYALGALTITGSGEVTFSGEGTITADNISLKNGATFSRNANISATTGISLDSGTVLRLYEVTESAVISGAGAVETYGTVVLANANTMTGGITVKPGSALSTTVSGGYGEYQSGWAYTAQRQLVVEDGGTVDINNVANNDGAVALTIAGKGILTGDVYSGAVTYSGATAISSGSRQISSLVLTGDALIDVGAGWGLVHSGWSNARLGLGGNTLTVRGTGTFPVVNVNTLSGAATTGTLILDGATLELSNAASNLAGVDIIAKGCSSINIATAPSSLGSLTIAPSANGTTASNWNLPSGFIPVVNTSNIDASGLSAGQVLTIFTAPSTTELTDATITVNGGGRFVTAIDGNKVTVTVVAGIPTPFLHYDFDNGVAVDTGKAADSTAQISSFGEAVSDDRVVSRNGKAVQVHNGYTPYWGGNDSGVSPFHAGEVTVTTVAKINETNIILWGLGAAANNTAIGIIAVDANTVSVVARRGTPTVETLATVTETSDLTKGWHFIAVVATESGTTLYVDDKSASSDKGFTSGIGQQGQLGSFHGGAFGAKKVGDDGYYLDDWRVYDAVLSAKEIRRVRTSLLPQPFRIFIR